jgi:glycosyltransferase involved in cell wall biosynthesis
MHFGRPILTSDLDFAHEVCGDAAAYFDPWRADAIARALTDLRDDAARRDDLVERGRARVAHALRTWPEILRDALSVLEEEGRESCPSGPILAGAAS